jgi:hypothetical protein
VTFTATDKERYLKALAADGGPPPKNEIFVFPDKYPPIEHLMTDDRDNIFIRTYDTDKEGWHYYEAFSKDGKPLGRFPLSFNVYCVVGNKMYSLERDDNGFDPGQLHHRNNPVPHDHSISQGSSLLSAGCHNPAIRIRSRSTRQ